MTTKIPQGINSQPLTNDALLIAMGCYPSITGVNKFGRNPDIAIGEEEVIWDGSTTGYPFPATALITSMSQTADQATLNGATVEIQGLDANWELVVQTALLGTPSTVVVTLTTPLIRVFRAKVLADVVSASPIRIHNAAENVDYAIISIGQNQTLMAVYTVPANTTAYMTCFYAHVNPGVNLDPTAMPIRLWASDRTGPYAAQVKNVVGQTSGGFQHFFDPHVKFGQKTDIYMTATPVGKAADVSAGFDLILVDNAEYGGQLQ